ncbi:glycosyltransferase family 4 protein [Nostoc sp. 'Lobaria pulmonaria (5183) cyanobiont']|uniref:glycosyltransferase family 4 protein n=1 Tax=Nostoc sp. 'Lobaria pulmonaria (5183) cyanobiont' TaxID=1618022 RepID=UPI000CF32A6D|nr:glycosyltransferase family 4 protein [Nostoc sp. 'Lobaria pulmonaria (5183) cyanobiont']AVH73883.1 group 1 glycosyltransferase [Nostoc sp. 'Lobaria pulmonaria (5183) cyanobiont']
MSQEIFDKDLIYQCSNFGVGGSGGVETYLASLFEHRPPDVSDRVIKSLKNIDQSQFKLLHIHSPDLLLQLTGECPAIFSVHNHSFYCPSGTKYLAEQRTICDRNFSYLGCTWGKLVDKCGSRRPLRTLRELQTTHQFLDVLKRLKITFIANSEYVRQELIENGVSPEQTLTLHCGISIPETATFPLSLEVHQNHRILFAGRIVSDKGLEWLLKTLIHTDPKIQLDIAGEGWERPRLEKLATTLGLNKRITWHGWCDSDKLDKLYQQCFAVIFPSVWPEPAGLVTLEAYSRCRPVIGSAVGGIPEHLRDGETGILVPSNNIQKLADAINELYRDYQKSRYMGEQGHTLLMKEFTMAAHVNNLRTIYAKTIAEFPSPANKLYSISQAR